MKAKFIAVSTKMMVILSVLKSQQDLIIYNKRDIQSPPFGKSTW